MANIQEQTETMKLVGAYLLICGVFLNFIGSFYMNVSAFMMIVLASFRFCGRVATHYFGDLNKAQVSLISLLVALAIGLTIATVFSLCFRSRRKLRDNYHLIIATLWLTGGITDLIIRLVKMPSFWSQQVIQTLLMV